MTFIPHVTIILRKICRFTGLIGNKVASSRNPIERLPYGGANFVLIAVPITLLTFTLIK